MPETRTTYDELFVDPEGKRFWPFSVEVEQALIGWAMLERNATAIMQGEMTVEDVYDPLHALIFERIFAKHEQGRPITPLTLNASLKHAFHRNDIDGLRYLVGCAEAAPAAPTFESLYAQVRDAARHIADLKVRRRASDALVDSVEALRSGEPVSEALHHVVVVSDEENERVENRRGAVSVADAAHELVTDLERNEDIRIPAAPTGLVTLDQIVGGNFPGEFVVIGGRPGMGKSVVGEMMARHAAMDDFAVDYFDLENKTGVLTARMLCDIDYDRAFAENLKPIQFSRIRLRRISAEERVRLAEATLKLRELDIQIHDREEMTIDAITAIARAKRARTKKRMMIVVDHMHLVEPSKRYFGRKVDEISEITKGLKRLAKRLDASVVALAQLSRGVEGREDKRPTMADFRESGSIEQDADAMYGLHRPQYYLEKTKPKGDASEIDKGKHAAMLIASHNVLDFGLLKNRHGPTTDLQVYCDVACSAVRDEKPTTGVTLDFKGLFA